MNIIRAKALKPFQDAYLEFANHEKLGTYLLKILLPILSLLLGGIVVSRLWEWFIVPLGVIKIGIGHALGIDCLICYLTYFDFEDLFDFGKERYPISLSLKLIVYKAAILGYGYIIYLAMNI